MNFIVYFLAFVLFSNIAESRPFRVQQYPNGTEFQCAGCHVNPSGGGTLNSFGQDVFSSLDGQNVNWGPELAALDSDGDGFSNGVELLDPEGTWETGDDNPGDANDVTAPYDENDFPTTSVNEIAEQFIDFNFTTSNVFESTVEFNISTQLGSDFRISVYSADGKFVDMIYNGIITDKQFIWNGNNSFGKVLSSGIYYIAIETEKIKMIKKVLKLS